jgi:NAD(P)-dependent dehydrogenase (short-subunit alcohol dehydrogenase family)
MISQLVVANMALPAGHFEETALQIQGKGFVVTGGGSGLGAATARRLVAGGARVLLIDLDEDAGASLAAELGANAHFARADVSDSASAERALAAYCETFGALHGLINCAGVAPAEKVLGREGPHRLESFARTVQINLIGAFNMVRLAAGVHGREHARGRWRARGHRQYRFGCGL